MRGISILWPIKIAQTFPYPLGGGFSGQANLLTPSPREIFAGQGTSLILVADLGAPTLFDCIYIGGLLPQPLTNCVSYRCSDSATLIPESNQEHIANLPGSVTPRRQVVVRRQQPEISRYVAIAISQPGVAAIEIGALCVGLSWSHPYAYGSGRQLIDTTRRTDLIDGGFGLEPGVRKAAYRWRFIDLSDAEVDALWDATYGAGQGVPVVVIEDASVNPPPDRSVHYGLLDRFEAYERSNPNDTSWGMSLTEWR